MDNAIMTAWKMVVSDNPNTATLGVNALVGAGNFPSFEDALCAMLNYVWEHGTWEDQKRIKSVSSGAKPNGWHWGEGGGGRGLAEFMGVIISYNVHGLSPDIWNEKPEFRSLGQSVFAPHIEKVLEIAATAMAEMHKAIDQLCSQVSQNDPHEVGSALFLYDWMTRKSDLRFKNILAGEFEVHNKLMDGVFKNPPHTKGQHVEYGGEIFEVTRVELIRSGANMEWRIDTCSLKKDGTVNNGSMSHNIHTSNIRNMTATTIEEWEYCKKEKCWVKKEATSGKQLA